MVEISAVASANTNLTTGAAPQDASHTATMSFDDFIDMINPLQHIPVVSSIYRAVAGDTINPVSRIVGDTLYGGVMGIASAGISAVGAIGDEIITASNDGKSASATVIAALFGRDDEGQAQPTDNSQPAPVQVAALQTPALQSPILEYPDLSLSTPPAQNAGTQPQPLVAQTDEVDDAPTADNVNKGIPLDRSKPAYGGVMDTSMLQNAQQNQAVALALAGQNNAMQALHNLRNSRFAVGQPVASPAPASGPASPALSASAAQTPIDPQIQIAMQNLIKELQAMKGVNQYKNAAQGAPLPGNVLDTAN